MIDFTPYENLQKIGPQMVVSIMEKVNQGFSDKNVPIPNRIESINYLRSLRKYYFSYFIELFGALKTKFFKNCLHYNENPRIQQISLCFIKEIFDDDDSYRVSNEMVYDIYYEIIQFVEYNNNNVLKEMAKSAIKTMSEKVINDAKIIVLIETLKNADENLCSFIFECFKNAIESWKGYIYLNYNFNDILDKLNLDEASEDYSIKIRRIFHILKSSLDENDEKEIISHLKDDNLALYQSFTS